MYTQQGDVTSSRRFPAGVPDSESAILSFPGQDDGCSLTFNDVESGSLATYEAGKTYSLTAVHHAKGQMLVGATAGTMKIDASLKLSGTYPVYGDACACACVRCVMVSVKGWETPAVVVWIGAGDLACTTVSTLRAGHV